MDHLKLHKKASLANLKIFSSLNSPTETELRMDSMEMMELDSVEVPNEEEVGMPEFVDAGDGSSHLLSIIQTQLDDNLRRHNAVWSPMGLYSSLASLALYASPPVDANFDVAGEMRRGLHLPQTNGAVKRSCVLMRDSLNESLSEDPHNVVVTCGTRLFFHARYKTNLGFRLEMDDFAHQVANVPFTRDEECASLMNRWAKSITDGRIPSIVYPTEIHKNMRLVVGNVVTLRGAWQVPFNVSENIIADFKVASGEFINVVFMRKREKLQYANLIDLRAHCVALNLHGGDLVVLLIVPKFFLPLEELEEKLKEEEFRSPRKLLEKLSSERETVLHLPKFCVDSEITWKDGLIKRLGVRELFSGEREVLRGVAEEGPKGNLHVSDVFQRVQIEVTETGVGLEREDTGPPESSEESSELSRNPWKVFADVPFLFRVVDLKTMAVVVAGRITRPKELLPQVYCETVDCST